MMSRIYSMSHALFNHFFSAVKPILNYLFQNISDIEKNASVNENGIGIARVGPKYIGSHIVMLVPKLNPEKSAAQLREIMDLTNIDARSHYSFFSYLTGSNFFLDMNNAKGRHLRKDLLPYLHPKKLHIDYEHEFDQLFLQLLAKHASDPTYKIISAHIFSLITRGLLGFEINDKLRTALTKIEKSQTFLTLLFSFLPHALIHLIPFVRILRNECEDNIKLFLRQHLEYLRTQDQAQLLVEKSNWLIDNILAKYPHKLADLTDRDIDSLIVDKDIRVCIGIAIGSTNLVTTIIKMLKHVFNPDNEDIVMNLRKEIYQILDKNLKITSSLSLNSEKMPQLHAVFLETLRHIGENFFILRYSKDSISKANLQIPARSHIIIKFDAALRLNGSKCYPAKDYLPERFINDKDASHHQGLFAPFGLGSRACPASRMTEVIFKNYLIAFARHINVISHDSVKFNQSKREYRYQLRHFFFNYIGEKRGFLDPSQAANQIADTITEYSRL